MLRTLDPCPRLSELANQNDMGLYFNNFENWWINLQKYDSSSQRHYPRFKHYSNEQIIVCQSNFLNGPTPASFWIFSFFSNTILQKNCRLQRDSNSDCRSRKQARWPLDNHQGHISKIPINNKFALNWQCSRLNNQNLE